MNSAMSSSMSIEGEFSFPVGKPAQNSGNDILKAAKLKRKDSARTL